MKKWELSEDDQVVAQGHDDLAVRRAWRAWLAASTEIQRLNGVIEKIKQACEAADEPLEMF